MGIFSREPERDDKGTFVSAPYSGHRALTAAAARVDISDKTQVKALKARRTADDWQSNSWEYFDLIGEIKQAATLIANVTSRVRLYVGYVTDDDVAPSNIHDIEGIDEELKDAAQRALRMLGSGAGGIPGLLQDAALNLFVAGECYLVQQPPKIGSQLPETWQIRSVDEIVTTTVQRKETVGLKTRRDASRDEIIVLPPNAFFGRIWRMHPRYSDEADSSMRGLLELCEELLLINKAARRNHKSRLNAGILYLPDDLSNLSQADGDIEDPDNPDAMAPFSDDESDSFEEELMRALMEPIADEGSASAIVPLIVRGPAEVSEKLRHFTMDRPFDQQQVERGEKVIERILVGLDIPVDIIKGLASVKYSNAIQIEDQLYKAHIEPLVLLIVDSLTVVFLRPVLRTLGFSEEEVSRVVMWYDPSAITSRPSKAEAADKGYEMNVINGQAWRRAHGFSETDAPTELQIAQRLAVDRGLLSEPVTEALLRTLIPDLLEAVRTTQLDASPDGEVVEQALDGDTIGQPGQQAETQTETEIAAPDSAPPVPLIEPGE